MSRDNIREFEVTLRSGNTLKFFVNLESNLVVVDLIAENFEGGNEFVRKTLNEAHLLSHCYGELDVPDKLKKPHFEDPCIILTDSGAIEQYHIHRGLKLHVSDEDQCIAYLERLIALDIGWCTECGEQHEIGRGGNFSIDPRKDDEWLCNKCHDKIACPDCGGHGDIADGTEDGILCQTCLGSGVNPGELVDEDEEDYYDPSDTACPDCGGLANTHEIGCPGQLMPRRD